MFPRSFLLLAVCVAVALLLQTGDVQAATPPYFQVYYDPGCNTSIATTIQLPSAANVTCVNYTRSSSGAIRSRYTLLCYPNSTVSLHIFAGADSDCNTSTSTEYLEARGLNSGCSPAYEHTYQNGAPVVTHHGYYKIVCSNAASSSLLSWLLPLLVSASSLVFSLFF